MYYIFITQSSAEEHANCFRFLATVNKTAKNMAEQTSEK